jgi:hypothetical protein
MHNGLLMDMIVSRWKIDPKYTIDETAKDFDQHEWYLGYFKT